MTSNWVLRASGAVVQTSLTAPLPSQPVEEAQQCGMGKGWN